MKKLFLFLAPLFLIYTQPTWAQKETRQVSSFSRISMGISADLYIRQGDRTTVTLQGDEDDLENITTEVKNATLYIKHERSGWNWRLGRVEIYVTTPEINEISLGGSGKVTGENRFSSDGMVLRVSGSGRMDLELAVDDLSLSISGSGKIYLSGEADRADLRISGSGNLDAENLIVDRYEVNISGSGSSRIHVDDALEARISGSGSVRYKGDPDKVISNVSGSGKVRKD